MPLSVVFVCTANICRSAFMQSYARRALDSDEVHFSSAGTHGFTGHPMSDEMAAEAAVWDLDVSDFRSRPLDPEILADADLVLTAERRHRQFILDDHPETFRKVLTLGQASRVAASLTEAGGPDLLMTELTRQRGVADPEDDIADPYRRGVAAQEAAARQMSGMLGPLLAALGAVEPPPSRKSVHG